MLRVKLCFARLTKPKFQQANPVPDVWENCKDEELAKAANDLDPEIGCDIASIDYQASYVNILNAVGYLNNPEVFFLATNVLLHVLCWGFSFIKEHDRRYTPLQNVWHG